MSEDQTDSEPEEEEQRRNYKVTVSEDENEERTDEDGDGIGCRQNKQTDDDDGDDYDEEEDDEDYEEVVVKPRHLNEVTSLTDKTSPWTSILTDPDLASLESLEAPEEPDLSRDEHGRRQAVNLETRDSSGKNKRTPEESDSFNGSTRDDTDAEGDDEKKLQASDERQTEEPSSFSEESGGTSPLPIMQNSTNTHDASCSLDEQESQLQPYP